MLRVPGLLLAVSVGLCIATATIAQQQGSGGVVEFNPPPWILLSSSNTWTNFNNFNAAVTSSGSPAVMQVSGSATSTSAGNATVYGEVVNSVVIPPNPGGATSFAFGQVSYPVLGASAGTILSFAAHNTNTYIGASFSGSLSNVFQYEAGDIVQQGSVWPTANYQFFAVTSTAFNGLTSGSYDDRGLSIGCSSAAIGVGGTLNIRCIHIDMPTGASPGGTQNDYGLDITGNCPTGMTSGTNCFAIRSASTAASQFAGIIQASSANGAEITASAAGVTTPSLIPQRSDTCYGIGGNGSTLSLIVDNSGCTEAVRLTGSSVTSNLPFIAKATSISTSSNISVATLPSNTSGTKLSFPAVTINDTGDSGSLGAVYLNFFGGDTVTSTSAVTFSSLSGAWFAAPTCSTNVTCTLGPYAIVSNGTINGNGGAGTMNGWGAIVANNNNGYRLINQAATATAPTLIPNNGSQTTGIGGTSGNLSFIDAGVSEMDFGITTSGQWTALAPFATTDTTAPTFAAGTLALCGACSPTMGANGEAVVYESTANGLLLQGQGSTNDMELLNSAGTAVFFVATGTTALNMNAHNISGASSINSTNASGYGTNGNAASSTNPTLLPNRGSTTTGMGANASGAIDLIAGGTDIMRLGTGSHAYAVNFAGAAANETGYVCYNSGSSPANELLLDTVICLASLEEYKNRIAPIDPAQALSEVIRMDPFWYTWNQKTHPSADKRVQPGLGAHAVEKIDPRLAAYSADGKLKGVRYEQMVAVLVAALKAEDAKVDRLTKRVAALESRRQ